MRLQLSTWQEIEEYLKENTGILVPIGSTEQHGPNGLIGTDAITSERIANDIGKAHQFLVAPPLNIGMAQHHLAFTGSISLKPTTFIAMIQDVVICLANQGFTHIFFLNGHGGNVAPLRVAFAELYSKYSFSKTPCPFQCTVANWYLGKRVQQLSGDLFGASEGKHATPSEVSLTYYMHPDCVKHVEMSPKLAADGDIRDALDYRKQFPDGRIASDPSLASVENGEKICKAAVQDMYESYVAFLEN